MDMKAVSRDSLFCKIFKNSTKVIFDASTRAVFEKIGVQDDLKHVTGLINFRSLQMHLMGSGYHERLAKLKDLQVGKDALKDSWYGFVLLCGDLKAGLLEVNPRSGQFGGIPIRFSSIFENYMNGLFSDKAKRILFQQMGYERNLTDEKRRDLISLLRAKDMLWVSRSVTNHEINKFILR
jgi:hypothetical protein